MTDPSGPDCLERLDALEQLLAEQTGMLGQDDLDGLLASLNKTDALLQQGVTNDLTPQQTQKLHHCLELHRRLTLAVADRLQVTASKIQTIRQGKRTLRIYGGL